MYPFHLIKNLVDRFQPDSQLLSHLPDGVAESNRLCRMNIIASLLASVVIMVMFLIRLNIEGLRSYSLYGLLAASLVFAILPYVIKRTGKYVIANVVVLAVAMIVLPVRVIDTGGLSSAVMSWYLGSGLVFFVIGSLRLGLVAYLLSVIELLAIYLALKFNWVSIRFEPSDDIQFWVFVLALTLSVSVIYWYEKQRKSNIIELQEKNQKISSDNNLLAQQKAELEQANLEKSTLINVLCHDIANPLNVIGAYAEIIEDENDELEEVKYISRAAGVIEQIIAHIRQLQSSSAGMDNSNLESVNIGDCIEQALFVFGQRLQQKKISIVYDKDQLQSVDVLAEKVSLSNFVINNIISNAIKFSEKEQCIEITAVNENDNVRLSIKDHGTGMSEEIDRNLFKLNKIYSQPGTDGETGTGLGMKVMASYVLSYGGKVEKETRQKETCPDDHGTTFHIFLKKPA